MIIFITSHTFIVFRDLKFKQSDIIITQKKGLYLAYIFLEIIIKEMSDTKIYKSQIYLKIIFIKYNSNIIIIYIVLLFSFGENDIGKIKELINGINGIYNNINNNYNYNFNPNRISLLTFTKGSELSNDIINYNN